MTTAVNINYGHYSAKCCRLIWPRSLIIYCFIVDASKVWPAADERITCNAIRVERKECIHTCNAYHNLFNYQPFARLNMYDLMFFCQIYLFSLTQFCCWRLLCVLLFFAPCLPFIPSSFVLRKSFQRNNPIETDAA